MYIWTAIDLDEQLSVLRHAAQAVTGADAACNHALSLPLHVSLRISFAVDDAQFDAAVDRIGAFLAAQEPFALQPLAIERGGEGLIWLRMAANDVLTRLHEQLVDLLQAEYSVPPHAYDLAFRFHASLFVGDCETSAASWQALKDMPFPVLLSANTFVIGCSETGRAGDYRVLRRIHTDA